MSGHPGTTLRVDELPKSLPIFPLTGVLLLPRGRLPLNVFEPRYLAMIEDALAARDRIVGMIQPRQPGTEGMTRDDGVVPAPSPLYVTGCAGRISSFSETGDGRYLITLTGVCRFNVVDELSTVRGYRRVIPDFAPWQDDLDPSEPPGLVDRDRLIRPLRIYFAAHNVTTDWDVLAATPDDRLVTTLAMNCPFAPQERQALLECRTLGDLAVAITALIEMAAGGPSDRTAKH